MPYGLHAQWKQARRINNYIRLDFFYAITRTAHPIAIDPMQRNCGGAETKLMYQAAQRLKDKRNRSDMVGSMYCCFFLFALSYLGPL